MAQLTELLKRTFRDQFKELGTSIPGHVIAFNSSTQLAQLQIGIERVRSDGSKFDPPPLIECPVHFPGGQFLVEYEINPGDEGLIVFSQRCIDGWVNTGGIAENPILRFHDYADAVFIPGVRSTPNKIPNFVNDGVRLRNRSGDKFIWLKSDGSTLMDVTGLHVTGPITCDSEITADVNGDPVPLTSHGHTNVTPGGGTSGTPVEI